MRIVDKRRDYYDIGMGLGYDAEDSIVYVRTPKEIEHEGWRSRSRSLWAHIFVGFCGKIYPGFVIHADHHEKPVKGICYSLDDIDKFVRTHMPEAEQEIYFSTERNRSRRYSWFYQKHGYYVSYWGRRGFEDSIEKMKTYEFKHYKKLFSEHNCPIFVVDEDEHKTYINPLLRPWEFYKVVDPYTAWQEVSMYVGGVLLAPVNPVPDIPDDTMRDIKGFDKWSFRKEPK